MEHRIKVKKTLLIFLALGLVVWNIFLFSVDITSLIESMGIRNAYLTLGIVSILSSASFLTSASFYTVFFIYANSGLDILTISIIGGIGMSVGDSLFFHISKTAGDIMKMSNHKVYNKVLKYVKILPRWGVYIFTFLYAAFLPIPNDILMAILGIMKFRYSKIIPIIILGNIVLLFLIATGIKHSF